MGTRRYQSHSTEFKIRLAQTYLAGEGTIKGLARQHSIVPGLLRLWIEILESLIRNQSSSGEIEADPDRYLAFSQWRYSWLAFSTYLRASSKVRSDKSFSEPREKTVFNSGAGSGSFIFTSIY